MDLEFRLEGRGEREVVWVFDDSKILDFFIFGVTQCNKIKLSYRSSAHYSCGVLNAQAAFLNFFYD